MVVVNLICRDVHRHEYWRFIIHPASHLPARGRPIPWSEQNPNAGVEKYPLGSPKPQDSPP
jgi:hypothetical protein